MIDKYSELFKQNKYSEKLQRVTNTQAAVSALHEIGCWSYKRKGRAVMVNGIPLKLARPLIRTALAERGLYLGSGILRDVTLCLAAGMIKPLPEARP